MPEKVKSGIYNIGRVNEDGRSRRGRYVVRGEVANQRSHIEWRPVQFLDKGKWYAVRVGPTERSTRRTNTVAHPLGEFSSKKEAVNYLANGTEFDKTY
jgi:hypothetical protein